MLGQHGPDLASHLVGQRNGDQHPRLAGHHGRQPRALRDGLAPHPIEPRHGADDQHLPDVGLAGLGDPPKPLLTAG